MSLLNSSDVSAGDDIDATDHNGLRDDIENACPTGCLQIWSTGTAPTGWLLCDGSNIDSVADTEYAALYAIIGTDFGGTGADDFDLPDMRGNIPLGKDNMGGVSRNRVTDADADTIGNEDGAETHTLLTAEMPSHTHTFGSGTGGAGGVATTFNSVKAGATGSTGGGGTHNNLQPFMTMAYIIKY